MIAILSGSSLAVWWYSGCRTVQCSSYAVPLLQMVDSVLQSSSQTTSIRKTQWSMPKPSSVTSAVICWPQVKACRPMTRIADNNEGHGSLMKPTPLQPTFRWTEYGWTTTTLWLNHKESESDLNAIMSHSHLFISGQQCWNPGYPDLNGKRIVYRQTPWNVHLIGLLVRVNYWSVELKTGATIRKMPEQPMCQC